MASPHVAGSVALCLGSGGVAGPCAGLTPQEVVRKLRDDAAARTPASPGYGFTRDPLHKPTTGRYVGYLAWAGSDFALVATPASITVAAGAPAAFDVALTPSGGFSGIVTLTASAPANVRVTPTSASTAPPYAAVHFTASSTTGS